MAPETLLTWLNQGALVVMAAGFLYLVKVTVNDNRHTLYRIEDVLKEIRDALHTQESHDRGSR